MNVPVAVIVFNRPKHTREVFAALRLVRPAELFVIADGPRPEVSADNALCAEVREVVSEVDWPCTVHRNFADSNLGLKERVSSGLSWVFDNVDRAIVLEDDCVAHPDFFRFCESLLERYADDDRVSVITGNNFQQGRRRGEASYYFSRYNHCWGWATWRRAWRQYNGDIDFWPEWKNSDSWRATLPDPVERRYWSAIFDDVRAGKINSWAYPWTASVWFHDGLTATPQVNLVKNIGFDDAATHTAGRRPSGSASEFEALGPISHPTDVLRKDVADRFVFNQHFGGRFYRFPWSPLRGALSLAKRLRASLR